MPEFNFDDLKILTANATQVFLHGEHWESDIDDPIACVLVFNRELLTTALTWWLDAKAEYHKDFAGTMGSIRATKYTERDEVHRINLEAIPEDPDDDPRYVFFRTFDATEFDPSCDMEHG